MTTTEAVDLLEVPTLDLDRIHTHPANPRRAAAASTEMVESILAAGIHVPLMVAPHPTLPGEFVLIDGHRREHGARQAGLQQVPVNVRYDLVTEAQQIEVMVVTGLQGEHLSPVEEAAAYEQLQLAGMDDDAIARATGFSKRRVRDRMKLNSLSAGARDGVHAGEITLTDIAALAEFEDDHEAYAELERHLGTPNFRTTVHAVRARIERDRVNTETIDALEDLGAVRVTGIPGGGGMCDHDDPSVTYPKVKRLGSWMTGDLGAPETHVGHLGWVLGDWVHATVETVCLDTTVHPEWVTEAPAARADDFAEKQAAREAEQARLGAADLARREWLAQHITGLFPTKSHQPLAALAGPFLTAAAYDQADTPPADLTTPTKTLAAFAAHLASEVADLLYQPAYGLQVDDTDEAVAHLQLWDWATAAGYPMGDVDVEYRARLETRLAELTSDEETTGG